MRLQKSLNIYMFAFIFIFIYGCSEQNVPQSDEMCTLIGQKCIIKGDESQTLVSFNRIPVVEEMITVKIDLPIEQKFVKAYVEGVNMNMGKSPFMLVKQSTNSVTGEIFLGSCNEEIMEWHLVIESIKKQDTLQQHVLFRTYQN